MTLGGTKKIILMKAAPQADGENILGGSDGDRGHQDSAHNALRKRAKEGQGHTKKLCPRIPRECGADLPKKKNKAGKSDRREAR